MIQSNRIILYRVKPIETRGHSILIKNDNINLKNLSESNYRDFKFSTIYTV